MVASPAKPEVGEGGLNECQWDGAGVRQYNNTEGFMKKAGWLMTVFFAFFMLAASVAPKIIGAEVATESLTKIGWPSQHVLLIGIIELICTILFVVPRTALLGAILTTGLLGGALASHWRADSPLFSYTLFSVYLGSFMWASLWLRDSSIRGIFPIIKKNSTPEV
jgi:hypothetical protein